MVSLQQSAQLFLVAPLCVMSFLPVDVLNQCRDVRRTDRKQRITSLPGKVGHSLCLHPCRRRAFHFRYHLCRRLRDCNLQSQMHMVRHATGPKALTSKPARRSRQVGMQRRWILDQRHTSLRTEHHMHQIEAQSLRHSQKYMPVYLNLAPRAMLVYHLKPLLSPSAEVRSALAR